MSLGLAPLFTVYTPAMSTLYTTVAAVLLAAPLSGTWRVSLHEKDGVELDFRMTFEQMEDGHWEAYSRPGAARGLTHAHPPERDRESPWSLGTLIGSDTGTFSGTRISDSPSTATNARRIP